MTKPTRILIVEDAATDADLAQRAICTMLKSCEFQVVETRGDFLQSLQSFQPDVILADYSLPCFDGMQALKLALEHAPLTPLVIWTGSMSENIAVECIKAGASNYVLKDNLKRLGPAILHALEERQLLLERKQAEEKYQGIFENSIVGIFQSTPEGRYLSINSAMAKLYGYASPQDMIESVRDIASQVYVDPRECLNFRRSLETHDTLDNYQQRNYRKDGSIIWTSTSARAVRDANGAIVCFEGFVQNITERKQSDSERQVLLEIVQGVADTNDVQELLKLIHHSVARAIYAENFFVVLYDSTSGLFEEIYCVDQYDPPGSPSTLEHSITAYVFRTGEPLLLTRERFAEMVARGEVQLIGTNSKSWLGIPLKTSGRTIGVMVLQDYETDNRYSQRDKDFMESIAAQIALVIERKQAEEALRENEEHYRAIFEGVQDAIFVESVEGHVLMVNERACEMFGYSREEFLTKTVSDLVPEGCPILMPDRSDSLRLSSEPKETINRRANGERFPIEISGRLLMINGKTVLLVVVRDITERKEAEAALLKSITQFRTLFEASPEAIMLIDPKDDWTILDCNSAACQMNGYSREELIGQCMDILSTPGTQSERASYMERIRQHGRFRYETSHRRKDGKTIAVDVSSSMIEFGNRDVVLEIDRDVTERKRADLELQQKNYDLSLLNAVNEAVVRGENLDAIIELLAKGISHIFANRWENIYSTIYMLSADKQSIVMQKYFFPPETAHKIEKLIGFSIPKIEIPLKEGGYFHKAMISGSGAITNNPEGVKAWIAEFVETKFLSPLAKSVVRKFIPQIYKILNIKSTIVVPLISEDETIGFLDVSGSGLFTPSDLKRMENIGGQLTAAIQRQQANEKIRRSEAFLQSIQNALSASIAILNETGTIVQVNSAWREFEERNGLAHPESGVGLNYLDICDAATGPNAEQAPLVAQAIRAVIAGQRNEARIEYPSHGPDGNHWFTLHITKFEDGDHTWVVLAHEDISERKQAEIAEREQRALAEALRDTAETLSSTLDYGEVLDQILAAVGRVVPHDAATIMLIESGVAQVVRLQGYDRDDFHEQILGIRLPLAQTTNLRQMLETRQPLVVYDTHAYPGWKRMAATDWLRSSVGAPISIYGDVIGFICLDARAPNFFTAVHAERLQAFANQAALAIHNARLLQQAQVEIAERIQAEKELRASEERFLQLANNIQEVFWMTDVETGKQIYMSPAAELIWGRSVDNLRNEPEAFINGLFPEDRDRVLQTVEREKNGEKMEIEYRVVRPDGSLRWVWDRAFPIVGDSGKVIRIAGITADITERRASELALVKSQSRYRELFDSSPISIWEEDFSLVKREIDLLLESGITDLHRHFDSHPEALADLASLVVITDANQAALDLYGVEHKETLLKGLTQVLSKNALSHFKEEVLGLISPAKQFVWEGTDRTTNGRQMEVVVTGSISHGYEEDWSKVIISVSDITERKRAEEEIRRRAEETAALLETSQALTSLDLQATLQTISSSAKNLFDADGCRIFLMEPNGQTLRCVLTLQENFAAFSDLKVQVGEGVTGAVAASGQAEIVNDMQNDPRSIQVPGTPEKEEEAIMFAPLKEGDRTIGVLSIRRVGTNRDFQPADLELLEAFAAMAASAVSNARLFEETRRRLAELEALYENGLAVGRLLEPRQIGERIIKTFASYLRWHHVTIRLKRDTGDDLDLVAFNLPNLHDSDRASAEQHFIALINKVGQGMSGWALQKGTAIRTGNVNAHPQYVKTQAGIQSGLYMPLKVGERVIGVISVESEVPDAFTEQDERLLATLASQAAIAFENARLYEAIQKELSERKRAEEALRVSEAHYRELADSITDILFELNHEMHYSHWNKATEALTGIPASVAIGKSMREIFGESEEQTRIEKIYRDVLTDGQPKTFETTLSLAGAKRNFEINAYPSRRGVSVVAKDVTDRKRSETIMQKRFELMEYASHHTLNELMQRTVDEVSDITGSTIGFFHFLEADQVHLKMQSWSTNTLRLFRVPKDEGTHLPLDEAGLWAEAARQRRPLIQNDYESLARRKGLPQGHVAIQREIVIPIIRNEKLMAVLGIGNKPQDYMRYDLEIAVRLADYAWDITERKQMEVALAEERNQLARRVEERTADLSRANSNLARALRVKDEFLANMSHELRTPLNAILGLSESLGEQIAGPLNDKQQKYITTISESGHHLLALINDILDLAKIEAGQITLDINKVNIHSVCQASLRMIKQLAQKKSQEVTLSIEDGLGLMWADERRLKQMIVNLLGNAVKFTPENGKIGLEVHGDQEANKITITVWDNGIGIKEVDLARLFQPFVQLDSGLARETTGTGLGLALVAQMARLHGGSVNASSEPSAGSRFSIVLPWEPALALDSATRLRITGKFRAIQPDATNKPVILLVEDTKEVIMMLQDYLELAGYKIVTAQDGMDAIVQAKLIHPDLILMDVQMPRMDGLEATRRLRSEPDFRYTPIIALTALAMPNDRERCLAAGMDEYISKPINLKALVKIIQSCLFSSQELKPQ
jgi:PAS domain S-box-containing protein